MVVVGVVDVVVVVDVVEVEVAPYNKYGFINKYSNIYLKKIMKISIHLKIHYKRVQAEDTQSYSSPDCAFLWLSVFPHHPFAVLQYKNTVSLKLLLHLPPKSGPHRPRTFEIGLQSKNNYDC